MVRESGISATKPIFPNYLVPNFRLPFVYPRKSSNSSAGTSSSLSDTDDHDLLSTSTTHTTPNNSPPKQDTIVQAGSNQPDRLSRIDPDIVRCGSCSTDLAFASQIVSKGFTGRHGKAFLVAPQQGQSCLLNLRIGRNENRQLVTGWHVVADISCGTCSTKLGWKYVDAKESSQKYKVGKFILETERVVTHRFWEFRTESEHDGQDVLAIGESMLSRKHQTEALDGARDSDDDISFDSENDDECEDIFAGIWDAETVAKRRRSMGTRRKSAAD